MGTGETGRVEWLGWVVSPLERGGMKPRLKGFMVKSLRIFIKIGGRNKMKVGEVCWDFYKKCEK